MGTSSVVRYEAASHWSVLSIRSSDWSLQVRGIGTDVAIVSAMVFLAQFILSSLMGTIVQCIGQTKLNKDILKLFFFSGSTVAVVICASVLSFCGAISANFVTYMDL